MVAQSARVLRDLLQETPEPLEGSPFAQVDEDLPQSSARWCRSYLSAALEHLCMWADFVAPLTLHPDMAVHHDARPAQTLARAALESSAQAVWVMAASNAPELLRRHLSLVLADWEEQRKAAVDPEVKEKLRTQRAALLGLIESHGVRTDNPPYLTLVTSAADEVREKTTVGIAASAEVERLWRASAGSAHGKMWPSLELRVSVDVAGRHYTFPDADAMSAMLILADQVTQYGVFRYVELAGHEPALAERLRETAQRWYQRIPKVPGAPARLQDPPQN